MRPYFVVCELIQMSHKDSTNYKWGGEIENVTYRTQDLSIRH